MELQSNCKTEEELENHECFLLLHPVLDEIFFFSGLSISFACHLDVEYLGESPGVFIRRILKLSSVEAGNR